MSDTELLDEVLQLTLKWQQREAGEDERARLERLLADSEQARRIYLSVMGDTITLREVARAGETARLARPAESFISRQQRTWQGMTIYWSLACAVAASLLCLAAWVGSKWLLQDEPMQTVQSAEPIGKIVNMANVDWSAGSKNYAEWSRLHAGDHFRFEAGLIDLLVDNGVQIVVEGPADLQLTSRHEAIARQGKLVMRVSPDAIGYQIKTPHADVIDLGTVFGVTVDPADRSDIVVYDGQVDLTVRSRDGGRTARRLETGEAVRVDLEGKVNRIMHVEDGIFLPPPQLQGGQDGQVGTISSVIDNISPLDTAKYYRIVRGGIKEDSPAYVDRLHQWNGLDDRGIPSCLRTADYVMTFNDNKLRADLEIAIRLTKPSELYILFDDRLSPPSWLRDDFQDSGWDIGLDEGYDERKSGSLRRTALGPGTSIDRVFSIWRRVVQRPDEVVVGAVIQQEDIRNPRDVGHCMLGIAAVPLQSDE